MDVTILICTYGDASWQRLAEQRALPSARDQGVPVHLVDGLTLEDARNTAAELAATEWLVYLDADDELEPGYVARLADGTGDIRVPSVRYCIPDKRWPKPRMPRVAGHDVHDCTGDCLPFGNWIVVGAAVRRDLVLQHGWRDWPVYEDWDLWLRLWQAGASVERCEAAVYRAWVRPESRNRGTLTPEQKHAVHQQIAVANRAPVPA